MERPSPGRRKIWNITMFIISYALNNLVSGIIYDTYVNYMQEMARSVATSFWAFYGYATFISALMLLLIPKTGYKKLLVFCSASWINCPFRWRISTLQPITKAFIMYIIFWQHMQREEPEDLDWNISRTCLQNLIRRMAAWNNLMYRAQRSC